MFALRAFRASWYAMLLWPLGPLQDVARSAPNALPISWAASRALLVVVLPAFCFWLYRANRDARTLGAAELSFSPGWAAGISFVPVANLIGPYRAVKEVYQASAPGLPHPANEAFRAEHVSPVLPLWWGVWIASVAWIFVPSQSPASSLVLQLLRAVAALLLIVVVQQIERRQAAREERAMLAVASEERTMLAVASE